MSDIDEIEFEASVPDEPVTTDSTGESYSINARQKDRDQLARDMEEFMKRGGAVQHIADNVRADPPRKPSADYGSAPI